MSEENVEIARRSAEAFNRGDIDAWLADIDPEIEWHGVSDEPDPGPFRGHGEVVKMVARWTEAFPDLQAVAEDYIDAGEYVVIPMRLRGRTPESDADIVVEDVFVQRYRAGKIVEVREFRTREEALEAAANRTGRAGAS
jgi:ketosteroid isomerase-like protein